MGRQKRGVLRERAGEVVRLIQQLLNAGKTIDEIADGVQVSARTVYRWLNEGRAPHPSFLEALRKLSAGEDDAHQQGTR